MNVKVIEYKLIKSTKFHCLALTTTYISKRNSCRLFWLIIKNNYLNNYSEKLFSQAIKRLF